MAASGYRVTLIVADGRGNEVRNGVDIVDVGVARGGRLGRMLVSVWRVVRLAMRRKCRFVHLHDPELLISGVAFKALGIRVVYDMHENVPKQILTKTWLSDWARKPVSIVMRGIERLILSGIPVVMAEESYVVDYRWVRRSVVVQNFPVLENCAIDATGKFVDFTVGYIGGVSRERGIIAVLLAVAELRHAGHRVNFECLGPVDSEVAKDQLFISACEDGWLHAPGRVDGKEGWKKIARCHVGVAVLAPLPNYVASWPTKIFEYMAMGLPVVVSDFPLYRNMVEQDGCGILVRPDDVPDIVRALERLMNRPDEARVMGGRGLRAVTKKYVWSNEISKLLAFYKSVSA